MAHRFTWQTQDTDPDGDGIQDPGDNCPTAYNPTQANFDADGPPVGNGAGIGNGSLLPGHDATVPNGDGFGDACDDDDDNDGAADHADFDPRGDVTYDDDNDGNPHAGCVNGTDAQDDGPSWDINCNGVRDGVSLPLCGSSDITDSDGDGLRNKWELCKWGTNFLLAASDADAPGDCKEALDLDGNGVVNSTGDLLFMAEVAFQSAPKDGVYDIDGNNVINSTGDYLIMAQRVFGQVSCP